MGGQVADSAERQPPRQECSRRVSRYHRVASAERAIPGRKDRDPGALIRLVYAEVNFEKPANLRR